MDGYAARGGSLRSGSVTGYDLLRMLGRDGKPTPLGVAFTDNGRTARSLQLTTLYDPNDESCPRSIHVQPIVQKSRHRIDK